MYGILWSIFLSFHLSHWEKYLTGVMYLPWSYDFSMLGGTLLYLITSVAGYKVSHSVQYFCHLRSPFYDRLF